MVCIYVYLDLLYIYTYISNIIGHLVNTLSHHSKLKQKEFAKKQKKQNKNKTKIKLNESSAETPTQLPQTHLSSNSSHNSNNPNTNLHDNMSTSTSKQLSPPYSINILNNNFPLNPNHQSDRKKKAGRWGRNNSKNKVWTPCCEFPEYITISLDRLNDNMAQAKSNLRGDEGLDDEMTASVPPRVTQVTPGAVSAAENTPVVRPDEREASSLSSFQDPQTSESSQQLIAPKQHSPEAEADQVKDRDDEQDDEKLATSSSPLTTLPTTEIPIIESTSSETASSATLPAADKSNHPSSLSLSDKQSTMFSELLSQFPALNELKVDEWCFVGSHDSGAYDMTTERGSLQWALGISVCLNPSS